MTFQFKIKIKGITHPPVWRRVLVPANYNFYFLHLIIQKVFDWDSSHLFLFSLKGYRSSTFIKFKYNKYEDDDLINPEDILLSKIFKKEKQYFTYIYDFGDNWYHTILLEKILPDDIEYPKLIAGKGRAPFEDCGGVWGYDDLKFLLSDPANPRYEEMARWCGIEKGEEFDPLKFDLAATQDRLNSAFKRWEK